MTDAPNIIIWISEETLSDESTVWNVEVNDEKFACVSEDDADEFARGLADLINAHTTETAGVLYA